jgi:hypothetical protein
MNGYLNLNAEAQRTLRTAEDLRMMHENEVMSKYYVMAFRE